jgi:hypothetical protein
LLGVRNLLSVILGWVWLYFTFDVGVRLITDECRILTADGSRRTAA